MTNPNLEPEIPRRSSSKRPPRFESFEEEGRSLNESIRVAKKKLKAQGSFNAQFWAQATEVESLLLDRHHLDKKISLRDFCGTEAVWRDSDEAKALFEKMRAQEVRKRISQQRAQELEEKGTRTLRASSMKLFTASKMGLNIKQTGAGPRDKKVQSEFRNEIIRVYGSRHEHKKWLWCPILGSWEAREHMTAAHIFPYMHGQDVMDAIFGKTKGPGLFSPSNGLLISSIIETYFDAGKQVIVPDVPVGASCFDIRQWVQREPRGYKIRIIDPTWELLDESIGPHVSLKWKDLDHKRLEFRTSFRPRARYLYFHYCVQILRRAWQHNGERAQEVLGKEVGKPVWGTPGRYLNKKMLKALVEELGHEYSDLTQGSFNGDEADQNLLLESASNQITKGGDQDDEEDDEEADTSSEDED
jgi:HNH endonuclease